MKPITYNTPLDDNSPVCPEQFFKNIEQPVTVGSITDAAIDLNAKANAICTLLSMNLSDEPDLTFKANPDFAIHALDALSALLDQQNAILSHPQVER